MRSHLKCEGVPMQKKGGNSHEDKSCDIGFIGLLGAGWDCAREISTPSSHFPRTMLAGLTDKS